MAQISSFSWRISFPGETAGPGFSHAGHRLYQKSAGKYHGYSKTDERHLREIFRSPDFSRRRRPPDVGCGKGVVLKEAQAFPFERIAGKRRSLYEAGLNTCEAPAFPEQQEWVRLQKECAPLEIIPDYPMRPSRRSIREICAGMGRIYNIHPDSAGSIVDAVVLAERIRELGAGLMIGDDSLAPPRRSGSSWPADPARAGWRRRKKEKNRISTAAV